MSRRCRQPFPAPARKRWAAPTVPVESRRTTRVRARHGNHPPGPPGRATPGGPAMEDLTPLIDRIVGERGATAGTPTLTAAAGRLGLGRIDWLEVDSQGTALRIINSLRDDLRGRLLAVDTEPGLRGAYVGEDLFSDVHGDLVRQGFW